MANIVVNLLLLAKLNIHTCYIMYFQNDNMYNAMGIWFYSMSGACFYTYLDCFTFRIDSCSSCISYQNNKHDSM